MLTESRARTELVDRALEGQSAEVRARVLAIILRYNIDVENEFFLIFVAIGHLLAIVEEAPENWRALFDSFERRLDEWSEQNLRTLAAIQKQGQEAERMAQCFLRLTDSLALSNGKTGELQTSLVELSKSLSNLNGKLSEIRGDSKVVLSRSEALLARFDGTEKSLKDLVNRVEWVWSFNVSLLVGVFAMTLMFTWALYQQQGVIAEQNRRLGWVLEKANRSDCWHGILPAEDPVCRAIEW